MKKIIFSLIFLTFNSCAKYDAFEFALDNGLRVVCVKRNSVPIIAFSIWYKCGSKCDLVSKSGVAHYLEHTAFSSKKEFRDFLEEIGAECNAFTSFNTICFYEIVPKEHLETIFLNESDRMKSIQIDDTDFLSEKGAILEERSMRTDNDPEGAYQETMLANMFNRKTGGIGIIGWKHEINGIKKQDLYDFHHKWFAPNNALIVIVGDLDLKQIKSLTEKYFGDIERKELPPEVNENVNPLCTKEIEYGSPKNGSFTAIEYIYCMPFSSKKEFKKSTIFDLVTKIANQPAFFIKKSLKHALNLAYNAVLSYTSRVFPYDTVEMNISFSSIDDLQPSSQTWKYLKNKLVNTGISNSDLEKIKRKEIISLAYKQDDIKLILEHFGWLLVSGCSLKEILSIDKVIQSVEVKECNKILREVFMPEPIVISKIIPKGYDRD